MKKFFALAIPVLISIFYFSCSNKRSEKPKILVFSKTKGFHHESIADGNAAIQKLGSQNNFDVDTTTNADLFNDDSLKQYSAVVFLSTTGDVLDNYRQKAHLNDTYNQAVDTWVFMQRQIANMTGVGMVGWQVLIF